MLFAKNLHLPQEVILQIANKHATRALTEGTRPYIQHFVSAIEEALAAEREHTTNVIREQMRGIENAMPINPAAGLKPGNYTKIPTRPDSPNRRGPVCHACGKRGPHLCKPFIVDTDV
jgi:hypothetical protein